MSLPRIYADFQNLDDENRVRLTCAGTARDLAALGIEFSEGMRVILYTDDEDEFGRPDELLLEGVVHRSESEEIWVAMVDWSAIRHASDVQQVNGIGGAALASRPRSPHD